LKIKVDEDLPKRVAEAVRGVAPDTLTVIDEGLSGILACTLGNCSKGAETSYYRRQSLCQH